MRLPACVYGLLLPILLVSSASAGIYRYVDADGNLVLSDTLPRDRVDSVQRIEPRPVMTIPAFQGGDRPATSVRAERASEPASGEYVIVIQSPEAEASYRRGGDDIPVALSVTPALAPGHRLQVLLDGADAEGLAAISLSELDRGSHTLVVKVMDKAGQVIQSETATFYVQQHSVLRHKGKPGKPKS